MLTLHIFLASVKINIPVGIRAEKLKIIPTNCLKIESRWKLWCFVVATQCQMLCVGEVSVKIKHKTNIKEIEKKKQYRAAKHVVSDSWRCEAIKSLYSHSLAVLVVTPTDWLHVLMITAHLSYTPQCSPAELNEEKKEKIDANASLSVKRKPKIYHVINFSSSRTDAI